MILQYTPLIEPQDGERVRRQIESTFVGCGKTVTTFEQTIAALSGVRHCTATTSGTTALMLALLAVARPNRPRKILFPAYTFLAGANAARLLGFEVELVDIERDTLCMSPAKLRETLARTGPVAAVMFVNHNANVGAQREQARAVCDQYDVPLIEDSAQCFGVLTRLVGQVGVFSFSVPKLVTTGQGGCVLANDETIARTVANLSDLGGGWRAQRVHENIGGNFKFNDILAAYGLSQIDRLDRLRSMRKRIFDAYRAHINVIDHGMESAWMVIYRTRDAARLVAPLQAKGIQAVQYYRPIHHNPPYRCNVVYPEAEAAHRELLYLPSSLSLTVDEIRYVCAALREAEG
jgi:perosamine synthetase